MAISNYKLSQNPQMGQQWLTVWDSEGKANQYAVNNDQYSQLQNSGIKAERETGYNYNENPYGYAKGNLDYTALTKMITGNDMYGRAWNDPKVGSVGQDLYNAISKAPTAATTGGTQYTYAPTAYEQAVNQAKATNTPVQQVSQQFAQQQQQANPQNYPAQPTPQPQVSQPQQPAPQQNVAVQQPAQAGGGLYSQPQQAQPQNYTVKAGDTLSKIAAQYGVSINDITGYSSGNPNLIKVGENLTINKKQPTATPQNQAIQAQIDQKMQELQVAGGKLADISKAGQLGYNITPKTTYEEARQYLDSPQVKALDTLSQAYGLDATKLFQNAAFPTQSPEKSIKDIVSEVMTSLNLPNFSSNIDTISKELEKLKNEQADEIAEINNNPWLSEASRSRAVGKVNEKYETRLNNKLETLKIYQDAADDARQEAQFAATMATNLYTAEQNRLQENMQFIIERAERAAEIKSQESNTSFDQQYKMAQLALDQSSSALDAKYKNAQIANINSEINKRNADTANANAAQAWANQINSGAAKITDVPSGIRSSVAQELNTITQSGGASELKTNALTSAQDLLNKLTTGKGTSIVGASRIFNFGYAVPGTDAANFQVQFNNLKSLLSLDNVKLLKGQGQVSDAERKLLSDASAKLDLTQSEKEFKVALEDIIKGLGGNSNGDPLGIR